MQETGVRAGGFVPSFVARPLLVIVRGKPGAGKTTLARRLAASDALGLPLFERDPIKAGLVETHGEETDALRAVIVPRSFDLFFGTIETWLRAGVSLIAENYFRADLHEGRLRNLIYLAYCVMITCDTSDAEARRRYIARQLADPRTRPDLRAATIDRMERGAYPWRTFDNFDLGVASLRVDTTQGYEPGLDTIITFCRDRGMSRPGAATAGPGRAG